MNFFRKQTFESILDVSDNSKGLTKSLTAFDLILFGLGAIIGAGAFVLTGLVAATYSGPAVTLSYAIAGLTCVFVALAYTELAAMLPASGSVYTYSYVALGEVFAWLIGGVLILELSFGAATVAAGWSAYMQGVMEGAGFKLPESLVNTPGNGGIINLPALLITLFVGLVLHLGNKDSKKLNAILVFIKLAAITAFVIAAVPYFDTVNWDNYMPFGFDEVLTGSSILFFAFTGFGVLASTAEECKNPKRDLTIGIIVSLVLSTLVYIIMAGLITGIAPYHELNSAQPMAKALKLNGSYLGSAVVAVGAICGMTTVLMMNIYAQSRIFYVIGRDGLLPKIFTKLHHKYDSPYITIWIFTTITAIVASFFPYEIVSQLSSMGALIDYITVTLIVMIFRIKYPDIERSFKCPAIFIVAPIATLTCVYLLFKQIIDKHGNLLLSGKLLGWWIVGILVLYLIRKSTMRLSS